MFESSLSAVILLILLTIIYASRDRPVKNPKSIQQKSYSRPALRL